VRCKLYLLRGQFPLWLLVHSIPLIMSLSTWAATRALRHTKHGNSESIFPLQFNLPYFIDEFRRADLQLLSYPRTFWKYFWAHDWFLVLEYWQVLFEYCLAVNVDFSLKLCLFMSQHIITRFQIWSSRTQSASSEALAEGIRREVCC
jgi:hypothetical protein